MFILSEKLNALESAPCNCDTHERLYDRANAYLQGSLDFSLEDVTFVVDLQKRLAITLLAEKYVTHII